MTIDRLERVLWELSTDRAAKAAFRADARAHLARGRLSEEEADLIVGRDVAGLVERGVNPMLTMGFWIDHVSHDLDAYREALRASTSEGTPHG